MFDEMSPQSSIDSNCDKLKNKASYITCRELLNEIFETSVIIVESYWTYNRGQRNQCSVSSTSSKQCSNFDSIFKRNPYNVPKEDIDNLRKVAMRVVMLNQAECAILNRYLIVDRKNFNQECFTNGLKSQRSSEKLNDRLANPFTDFFKAVYDVIESASRHWNCNYLMQYPVEVKTNSAAERETVVRETVPDASSAADLHGELFGSPHLEFDSYGHPFETVKLLHPNMKLFHEDLIKVIKYMIDITKELLESYKMGKVKTSDEDIIHNLCQDFIQIIEALVTISQSKCLHISVAPTNLIGFDKTDFNKNKRTSSQTEFPFSELRYLKTLQNLLEDKDESLTDANSISPIMKLENENGENEGLSEDTLPSVNEISSFSERNVKFNENLNRVHMVSLNSVNRLFPGRRQGESDLQENSSGKGKSQKENKKNKKKSDVDNTNNNKQKK